MKPVLVIPVWVEVPDTKRFPVMLALVVTSKDRFTVKDCKDEEAVVEVATNLEAVNVPAVSVSPCTANVVPGEVVPMPRRPCSSILTLSVKEPVMFLVKKERKEVGEVVETDESTPLIWAEEVESPDKSWAENCRAEPILLVPVAVSEKVWMRSIRTATEVEEAVEVARVKAMSLVAVEVPTVNCKLLGYQ